MSVSSLADELALLRVQNARLAQVARHNAFLAELAALTQPLEDPDRVMATAAGALAEHLEVDRCAYAPVEDERVFVITGDCSRVPPSIVGRWALVRSLVLLHGASVTARSEGEERGSTFIVRLPLDA